ncbi:hypothetical protein ACJMK2_014959 [Sinanodonta woodiana]|uniref:Tetraspanin n=1 Tax=Sinanodonta woodiana TaxID=1069815 RepID=A0ABD3V271_SINWO
MVEGGMKCVKILIFSFNLLFVLVGIALIACGAYVQIELKKYFQLVEGSFDSAAALLIAVGVIVFLIAAFGCCGAIRENHTCVMIYAVLLTIIFILEIAGGIAGFVLKGKVQTSVENLMNHSLDEQIKNHPPKGIWDDVQKEFKCCGVNSYTDWISRNSTVPDSCCMNSGCNTTDSTKLFTEVRLPSQVYNMGAGQDRHCWWDWNCIRIYSGCWNRLCMLSGESHQEGIRSCVKDNRNKKEIASVQQVLETFSV